MAGASTAVGAFLAFGMTPLVSPPVHADPITDWIFDLVDPANWAWLDQLDQALTGLADPAAWDSLFAGLNPANWDLSGLSWNTPDTSAWDGWLANLAAPAAAEPAGALAAASFFESMHQSQQDWITSPLGSFVDTYLLNPIPHLLFGRDLIGNGTVGISGGPFGDAAGGPGGLLFGDGGAGGTDASGAGGYGGDAGMMGNGGVGGSGINGAAGGLGGTGGWLFGDGGVGGHGGDGVTGTGGMGGAGGNGGSGGDGGNGIGDGGSGRGGAGGPGTNATSGGLGGRGGDGGSGTGDSGGTGRGGPGGQGNPGGPGSNGSSGTPGSAGNDNSG